MLDKNFDHAAVEPRLYAGWEASGAFAADPASAAAPFTIMIPPPNVTGSLHIGHALTFTVQDMVVRWRRMQGRDTLWQPGTDHAGIATQMVVERLLAGQGADRRQMGRDAFLAHVWEWKAQSGGTITRQLRRLGASLDWPRERFTMDEGLSTAVREVFCTLHAQGLIYRDRRLVNWDPVLGTAISDLEVESREVKGHIWHLRYPVEGEPGRYLTVATTRPETMLGDTAVAVHPEDARYAELVGRHLVLPLVRRRIPVVADTYSDPEKGTGAVKITPAHDFNDFEVGRRHGLAMPSIFDASAKVTLAEIGGDWAEPEFVRSLDGLDRFAARAAIVARLEEMELLAAVEPHGNQVPHGDRSGVPIEPRLTLQWYVDARTLAQPAIAAVESGATRFVPRTWENTFFAWMRDIQPWCVSRQLWWGHQIPAWYAPDGTVFVARTEAEAQAQAGADVALTRDPDVLDTWFSSALWPFSTLGWPEPTPELAKYYPGDVLVTGFDIIFFWVARMMMMGLHFRQQVPFREVYIHGLVRDERGQKMSKSKGNVMDPLELIEAFGTDALRFTIASLTGPGRDVKLGRKRVEDFRSFGTKIWNAARFLEMNGVAADPGFDPAAATLPLTRWILDGANRAVAECTTALEAYRFDDYAAAAYRFVWGTYCDWFVEFAKPVLFGEDEAAKAEVKGAAQHVFGIVLRLLHPVMPFITEELWHRFGFGPECSLIRASWPAAAELGQDAVQRGEVALAVEVISNVRRLRSEMNVPVAAKVTLLIAARDVAAGTKADLLRWLPQIDRLARVSAIEFAEDLATDPRARSSAQVTVFDFAALLPLADVIDLAAERLRLGKDRARAEADLRKIAAKLDNAEFVARAKEEVVEENRERLAAAQADMARLDAALARIAG